MRFNFWKKDYNLHQTRANCITAVADLGYGGRKEVIESMISVYLPDYHLHKDPKRKAA